MYAVVVEASLKAGEKEAFLKFYHEQVIPFAKKKTKVKEIKVMTEPNQSSVVIYRTYASEADTKPLTDDHDYQAIVAEAAKYIGVKPARRVLNVHAAI